MNAEDRELVSLIRETLPPVREELPSTDLWSRLHRRLVGRRRRVEKLDWVVAALAAALLTGVPEAVTLVLYHF